MAWWMTLIKAMQAKQAVEAGKGGKGGYHRGDPMALMGTVGLAGATNKTQAPQIKQGQPTGTMNYPGGRARAGLTERDLSSRYGLAARHSVSQDYSGLPRDQQDSFWNDTYF